MSHPGGFISEDDKSVSSGLEKIINQTKERKELLLKSRKGTLIKTGREKVHYITVRVSCTTHP